MRNGNLFFHRIAENVESALIKRQTAYSEKKTGIGKGNPEFDYYTDALTWRYRKNAWANLYWHCPTGKFPDSLICGSDFVNWKQIDEETKIKRSNYPKNSTDYALYEPMSDNDTRKVPLILLQSVNITNEGRYGSLQKVTLDIKAHSMKQLEELESKVMFPGADLRVEYGWTGGLGPKTSTSNPDEDNFIGIVYNFSWTMNPDLTFLVNIQAVGKGFALTALPSIGLSVVKNDSVSDTNEAKTYADSLITKLRADVKKISSTFKNDKGFAKGESGDYSMVYAINSIKHDATVKDKDGNQTPSSQTVYYVKLSDIFNYYNEVVLKKLPRISDGNGYHAIKFSANWGIQKGGEGGEQEDSKLEDFFLPCSISILDQEIVSTDPVSILFNDCANYRLNWSNTEDNTGIWKIDAGEEPWAHASFARPALPSDGNNCSDLSGVNLGEILVGVDYLIEVLERLGAEAKTPIAKSVQALGQELFLKISDCSGELYKLSWIELEMKKSESKEDGSTRVYTENWICVTDAQYSICTPPKWTFGIEKPDTSLVKNISLSSKIPNSLFTQLYVGGRVQNNISAVSAVSGIFPNGDPIAAPFWLIKGSSGEDHRLRTSECQYFTDVVKKEEAVYERTMPENKQYISKKDNTSKYYIEQQQSYSKYKIVDGNMMLSKYYKLKDFNSRKVKYGPKTEVVPPSLIANAKKLAEQMDIIRDAWKASGRNRTLNLNSVYRTAAYNKSIEKEGAVPHSYHTLAKAVDFGPNGGTATELFNLITKLMKNGSIIYGFTKLYTGDRNFVHYDIGYSNESGKRASAQKAEFNAAYKNPKENEQLVAYEYEAPPVVSSNKNSNLTDTYKIWYNSDGTKSEKSKDAPINTTKTNTEVQYTDGKLPEMRALMGTNGYSNETESKLRSALIRYVAERKGGLLADNLYDQSNDRYMFMRRDLYPLECTITIDGIAGFRFGDAIMVDYLPQRYKTNICFIVTKVLHTISKNGWDTVLNLQAKIITNITQQNLNQNSEMGKGRTVQEELNPRIQEREYNELTKDEVDNDSANVEEKSKTYPERKNKRNN